MSSADLPSKFAQFDESAKIAEIDKFELIVKPPPADQLGAEGIASEALT